MKTLSLLHDGRVYFIVGADDDQHEPRHGDTVRDTSGRDVAYVTHDGEYWVAEDCTGPGYVIVHENEPDAAWTALKACIAGQY